MSDKFSGFSQADIEKVKMTSTVINKNKENVTGRTVSIRKPISSAISTTTTTSSIKSTHQKDPLIDQAMKKQQPKQQQQQQQKINEMADESQITSSVENSIQEAIQFQPLPIKICAPPTPEKFVIINNENNNIVSDNDDHSSLGAIKTADKQNRFDENGSPVLFKGVSLKEYESQRRMIEEQNKQKKELLSKAIEQRYERTAAEAKKLNDIKYELDELESDLASDVALLRKHIDLASVKYMNAHKYYQQIETAFLKAKMDVQQAREKKDLLAEHLNIIITTNEDKKAQKLSYLMEQVGLTKSDDELKLDNDKLELKNPEI